MGIFRQFLTELSARDTSDFSFQGDNFSKCQWIFTKLGMCIGIFEFLECRRKHLTCLRLILYILISH